MTHELHITRHNTTTLSLTLQLQRERTQQFTADVLRTSSEMGKSALTEVTVHHLYVM